MGKIKNIDELFDMIFTEMDADDISKELSAAARRKKEKEEKQKKILERKKEICDARVKAVNAYADYFKLLSPDLFNQKDIDTVKSTLLRELAELEDYFKDI